MREFLLYVCAPNGKCGIELTASNRRYDLAVNDFTGSNEAPECCEYRYSDDVWKFRHVHQKLAGVADKYKAVAVWDDDVEASPETLNRLFEIGLECGLDAWQPALTRDSVCAWWHLFEKRYSTWRHTSLLDLMCPFFSQNGLAKVWDTFDESDSGWGIEQLWTQRLGDDRQGVIDAYPIRHVRPLRNHNGKLMPSGMTPLQEAELLFKKYSIIPHRNVY